MLKAFVQSSVVFAGAFAAVVAATGEARATSSETAMELCSTEMQANRNAQAIRDLKVRRHDDVPYVYGNVDFADIKNIHFRCKVRHDALQDVRYLVSDPDYVDGRMWVDERPQGTPRESIILDEPAMAAPPLVSSGPHFIRAPETK